MSHVKQKNLKIATDKRRNRWGFYDNAGLTRD